MKKIKQFSAVLLFSLGMIFVADIIAPGTLEKLSHLPFISAAIEGFGNVSQKGSQNLRNVLGTTMVQEEINKEELTDQVGIISSQVLESGAGKKVRNQVEEILTQATDQIQQLPEEQMKKLRKELKKQICEEWLEEN